MRVTILASWIRRIHDAEELVFISDSRLSGDGRNFDACAKILTLPRSDCAIAFAGYTGHAFPMMLQLDLAIGSYEPARRGGLDISSLRTHALKLFDRMAKEITSSPLVSFAQSVEPEANFLFGGYSWVKKKFELWSLAYRNPEDGFVASPAGWVRYHPTAKKWVYSNAKATRGKSARAKIAFGGDQASVARTRLLELLTNKYKNPDSFQGLNWEPFEVVRDMLRDQTHSETIGGAPQVVKVYQYMQTAPLAVYWPNRQSGQVVLQGRPCLGYEQIDRWVLDPDTLISHHRAFSKNASAGIEPGAPQEI
jgi:hypothetical protein